MNNTAVEAAFAAVVYLMAIVAKSANCDRMQLIEDINAVLNAPGHRFSSGVSASVLKAFLEAINAPDSVPTLQ